MNIPLNMPIARSKRTTRSGVTTVEFAVVAPVAFLLLFGALELGHANMVFHSVEAAAYEGPVKESFRGQLPRSALRQPMKCFNCAE